MIRAAQPRDLLAVEQLLTAASLPTLGVKEHFDSYLVHEGRGGIEGAIGLELYGQTALLRSAVVAESLRGKGIGSQLFDRVVENARERGIKRLILLTNTAETYFARKGFKKINQADVTGPITSSVEFTGACPSHVACMELLLEEEVRA